MPATSEPALDEVVVTARRKEERLQDVPVAVTALSGEQLQARGIIETRDLSNAVPGLTMADANSPTTLIFVIRGLGNTNPNTGSDASVGFYLNDVPINLQNGTNLALFDLQNVQVLKGPQGTLFGRNTTGGAVLINTARPTNKLEGYVKAGGTFFDEGTGQQAEAALNLPVTDTFALRLAVNYQKRDGWVKNIIDPNAGPAVFAAAPLPAGQTRFGDESYINSKAWRLSALWHLSDALENLFVYSGEHFDSTADAANTNALNPNGPIVQFAPFLGVPDPTLAFQQLQQARSRYYWTTQTVSNNPLGLKTNTASNTTTWNSGGYTLKNILGYRHVDENYVQEIVGLPGEYFVYQEHTGGHNFSEELQLQGKSTDERLHWVTGLFYFDERRFANSGPGAVFDGPDGLTYFVSKSKSYSVFAQGTQQLAWVDGLSLTVGGRYTVDKREGQNRRIQPVPGGPPTCTFPGVALADCQLTGSTSFRKPTYTISLDYKLDPESLVYLASRRGYRSGGYNATPGDAASFAPFKPETVTDYELGVKKDWRLASVPVRTNIAIYTEKYKDIQRLVVDPANITIQNIVNAGEATVKGAEAEVTIVPVAGLEIDYGFAYVDPVYDRFMDGGRSFAGETFAYAPHITHNVSVSYTLPTDRRYGPVTLRGDFHHQSAYFYDDEKQTTDFGPPVTLTQPAYGMLSFDALWKSMLGGPLDLDFFVRNAANTGVAPNGAPTYNSFGIGISFFSVPPRMYGFNLRYNFGS